LPEKISKRRFWKYLAAGLVIAVAAAAGGGYYFSGSETVRRPYSRQKMPDYWKGIMFVNWLLENSRYVDLGMSELSRRIPANIVALWVPFYTDHPDSDRIFTIYDSKQYGKAYYGMFQMDESWPPDLIGKTLDLAHGLGFQVAYWPNVGPVTQAQAWEGALNPTPAVFMAYREFKAEQAALAEKHQCEMFWIGNEWNKSYIYGEEWRKILEAVRNNFSGAILVEFLYQGEWEWKRILEKVDPSCFELMDYMGLSMILFPMSPDYSGIEPCDPSNYSPTVLQLVERWQRPAKAIEEAYKKFKKPIFITELAAYSYDGGACEEWRRNPLALKRAVDFQEQADLFEAAMRVLTALDCVHGVSWNKWNAYEPGLFSSWTEHSKRETQFQGKPAEKVLKYWYSKKNIRDGIGLPLTPDGHVDLKKLDSLVG